MTYTAVDTDILPLFLMVSIFVRLQKDDQCLVTIVSCTRRSNVEAYYSILKCTD